MKCISCGEQLGAITRGTVPFDSLPGTVLVGVEVRRCSSCGEEEIGIPRMDQLNHLLANLVANRPGRLTGAEIRFLRKHLGWSGADFARFFQTDPAVVSRWETGKQKMDVRGEQLLRVVATRLAPIEDYREYEALLLRPAATAPTTEGRSITWQGETWQIAA
jgi:putative transcriptional regulator